LGIASQRASKHVISTRKYAETREEAEQEESMIRSSRINMEHPTVSVFLSCLLLLFSAMGTSFAEPNPMDQPRGANIARHPPGMISEESEGVEYKSFVGETGRLRVFDSPYGRILAGSEVPERESAGLAAEPAQTRASTTLAQAKGAAKEQNEGEAKPLSEPGRSVTDAGLGKDKKLS
jgi:hypothetical protein